MRDSTTSAGAVAEFGQWVRQRRREHLLTQEELARRAKVSIRTIQMLESGRLAGARAATRRQLIAALDAGPTAPEGGVPPGPPAQLPRDVAAFTGRAATLDRLDALLASGDPGGPVGMLSGAPGVGKTALAVHWGHRVLDQFPDGQLYIDLRGYDPEQPVQPAAALAGFLRALGVASHDLPGCVDELSARYRTLLATRRMLVLLDNACTVEQVRPLLPGTRHCFVLVTSRDTLAGLVARDGAVRLQVGLLDPDESIELLRRTLDARVDADPAAAAALANRCGRLPLALRIAAERALAAPGAPLGGLVHELTDERRLLALLDAGDDPRAAVRAVFSWSFRELAEPPARLFALLGLHPGTAIDVPATAALMGGAPAVARALLDRLIRGQLVTQPAAGRYGMHDLLRAYAAERAATLAGSAAALTRLFDYYIAGAAAAVDTLYPQDQAGRPAVPGTATPPEIVDDTTARAWLDTELANLVAVSTHATTHGRPAHATRLASVLRRFLDTAGHWAQALTVHGNALVAACAAADRAGEADALHNMGLIYWRLGRGDEALDSYHRCLAIREEIGDPARTAVTLNNLGVVYGQRGEYQVAFGHIRRATELHLAAGNRAGAAGTAGHLGSLYAQLGRHADAAGQLATAASELGEVGDRNGRAVALDDLGRTHRRLGRYADAERCHTEALDLARQTGDRLQESAVLTGLGQVRLETAEFAEADRLLTTALAIRTELGDRAGVADTLDAIGQLHLRLGRAPAAARYHRRALAILGEIGDRRAEPAARNSLAEALRARGQVEPASREHRAALDLAEIFDNAYEQARAIEGLAEVGHLQGSPGDARARWQDALRRYVQLGTPEAARVRDRMARLAGGSPAGSGRS
jgi:tetratricopeptide (TPR) repeat protein/transcriptional regulator with XRE-family HTH domain